MNSSSIFQHHRRIGKRMHRAIRGFLTEYETPKLVLIHSSTFAVLLRIIQIIILIYSVVYLLIYEKGYQKHDTTIISSVTLKVKGVGYINSTRSQTRAVDVADYIMPPMENNAIFIMTNFIQTDQTRSKCAESVALTEAVCENDTDCENKAFSPKINGRWTGRCLLPPEGSVTTESTNNTKKLTGLCEYAGWCPPQDDLITPMLIQEVLNFTIFIKNSIEFPEFNVKHQNMIDNLKQCIYHPKTDKDCPIFSIGYIMNKAEQNITEQNLMLFYGGVIRVKVDWDCNLDRKLKLCKPEYSFARLDVPFYEKPFSFGFNFRYASYWKHDHSDFRTLVKAYGLRLIITVNGKAGKFNFITLTLNTGSLIGIFGLATFLCDIVLFHLSKKAHIYRRYVFETVHLGTRLGSVTFGSNDSIQNNYEKYSKSQSHDRLTSSNGTTENIRQTLNKTVVMRPLTLMRPNQLTHSQVT